MFGPYGFDAQRDIAANFNRRISVFSTAAAWFFEGFLGQYLRAQYSSFARLRLSQWISLYLLRRHFSFIVRPYIRSI